MHSNDCYTASAPSKLTGFLTTTDARGREVINPVFEFDACFDPQSDTSATGTFFPSLFVITSTSLTADADGKVGITVTCGTGSEGCAGTVDVTAGGQRLGSVPYNLKEESTATLRVPESIPADATDVTFEVRPDAGVGSTSPVTLAVQGH